MQWSSQQHLGQQCQQQQPTDGAALDYTILADASNAPNPQTTAAEPLGSAATTTTTSIPAWGILMNLPYHFLTGQGPNGSQRLA
jgi:hypothetical protein